MPGKDGTGPAGQGSVGGARGRGQRGMGAGLGGYCVCPKCGATVAHQPGYPCSENDCPKCGTKMVRK